jgi:hypothetical protein
MRRNDVTMMDIKLEQRDRTTLELVGCYCQVHWTHTNRLAKRQCEKCVYTVRGIEGAMICLELIYDAIDGVHKRDAIYWVPIDAVQYLHVISEAAAKHRIELLEREVMEEAPRD